MQHKIRHLVFSGGGAKGVAYAGAHAALEQTGVLSSVEKISGASAGAIISAFIAAGMNSQACYRLLQTTSYPDLLGKHSGHFIGYRSPGETLFTKTGDPLEAFIRANIIAATKKNLQKINPVINADLNPIVEKIFDRNNEKPNITFRDLKICAQYYPQYFKECGVTAVTHPAGDLKIFNAKNTPDIESALACRASASLPVFLAPAKIGNDLYMDGGFYDNLPDICFDAVNPQETLLFAFGEGPDASNPLFQALYGKKESQFYKPSFFESVCRNKLIPKLAALKTPYYNTHQKELSFQKIRDRYPLRTVELRTGELLTTNFDSAQKISRQLAAFGYLDTINYIINHDLYDEKLFQHNLFFTQLIEKFFDVFQEIRKKINSHELHNHFHKEMLALQTVPQNDPCKEKIAREMFYKIKKQAEDHPTEIIGFSLASAVEWHNGWLSRNQLGIDIYAKHLMRALEDLERDCFRP